MQKKLALFLFTIGLGSSLSALALESNACTNSCLADRQACVAQGGGNNPNRPTCFDYYEQCLWYRCHTHL